MPARPPETTALALCSEYDALLLDAYGVIVAHGRALPGASELVGALHERQHPYFIVTNDASRTPASCARFYDEVGLPIPEDRVISSGSLLAAWFRQHDLAGARCVVLGPADSRTLVRDAGGALTDADDATLDVLVVADEATRSRRSSARSTRGARSTSCSRTPTCSTRRATERSGSPPAASPPSSRARSGCGSATTRRRSRASANRTARSSTRPRGAPARGAS
jgi:hypothetical protein